jgi:hypothetical protein
MDVFRFLMGLRNGSPGVRSSGGLLLVMMALAGLLTGKPGEGTTERQHDDHPPQAD